MVVITPPVVLEEEVVLEVLWSVADIPLRIIVIL